MSNDALQTPSTTQQRELSSPINTKAARPRLVRVAVVAASAALLLGACSTTMSGMGGGDLVEAGKTVEPVLISWTSDNDALSGTMVATLPDLTYSGPFFEITQQTREESLAPLWGGWNEGWYDWPYWINTPEGPYEFDRFITHYSGKVVANLSAPDGSQMRCRLHLIKPASGMAGGGEGECQIAGDGTIQARF